MDNFLGGNIDLAVVIFSKISDDAIFALSGDPGTKELARAVYSNNMFWKCRVELKLGYELNMFATNWKQIYLIIGDDLQESFEAAIKGGLIDAVRILLEDPRVNISKDNEELALAFNYNQPEIMLLMLNSGKLNTTNKFEIDREKAASGGYIEVVELSLAYGLIDETSYRALVTETIKRNEPVMLRVLLESNEFSIDLKPSDFATAIDNGFIEVVRTIMDNTKLRPDEKNYMVVRAIQSNNFDMVKFMFSDGEVYSDLYEESYFFSNAKGNFDVAWFIFLRGRVNPGFGRNFLFIGACSEGRLEEVKILLADSRVNPADENNKAIRFAIENNHVEVVKLLMKDPRVDPTSNNDESIKHAIENNYSDMIKLFVEDKNTARGTAVGAILAGRLDILITVLDSNPNLKGNFLNGLFEYACRAGQKDIVLFLLKNENVDPAAYKSSSLIAALDNEHPEIVKILLADGRANPAVKSSYSIRKAYNEEIVKMLLEDKRANPSVFNNEALMVASNRGWSEKVKLLIQDERVDPSIDDNIVLIRAVRNGWSDVVSILLKHPLGNPSARNNKAIRVVSKQKRDKHLETLKLLLDDPRVDPAVDDNEPIINACKFGNIEMVKLLLSHHKVNPGDNHNYAIGYASECGHIDIVKLLLQDSRVNPADNSNYAFIKACEYCRLEVAKLLLTDPRVDIKQCGTRALKYTCGSQDKCAAEVVEFLLTFPEVDPSVDDNYCIIRASKMPISNVYVVGVLLKDPRVEALAQGPPAFGAIS